MSNNQVAASRRHASQGGHNLIMVRLEGCATVAFFLLCCRRPRRRVERIRRREELFDEEVDSSSPSERPATLAAAGSCEVARQPIPIDFCHGCDLMVGRSSWYDPL